MGQKVHPYGFRLGVTKTWRSRWFAKADYAKLLMEDLELKESLASRLKSAGVSSIEVDRPGNKLRITIRTSRPGIVIGCKGIKVRVSGRLNGAEIARSEWYLQGQLPLHTLRADIDYGFAEARTTYGVIGIKCWIYKGEVLGDTRRTGGLGARDPEPRRRDRGDRRGDRRDRGPR